MSNYNLLNRFHIMDMIEPGLCPNFYLLGKSISLLEETTVELTTIIERSLQMEFSKVVLYYLGRIIFVIPMAAISMI